MCICCGWLAGLQTAWLSQQSRRSKAAEASRQKHSVCRHLFHYCICYYVNDRVPNVLIGLAGGDLYGASSHLPASL